MIPAGSYDYARLTLFFKYGQLYGIEAEPHMPVAMLDGLVKKLPYLWSDLVGMSNTRMAQSSVKLRARLTPAETWVLKHGLQRADEQDWKGVDVIRIFVLYNPSMQAVYRIDGTPASGESFGLISKLATRDFSWYANWVKAVTKHFPQLPGGWWGGVPVGQANRR